MVAPIFVLVVMVMFGSLIDRYGEVVRSNARVNLTIEAEALLLTLEDELIFASEFRPTLTPGLSDPWEPTGGWDHDTTPPALLIEETALNADRRDPDRDFVRFPHPIFGCSVLGSIALNNLIYFSVDNPSDDYRTLYKRNVVPDPSSLCDTNFKTRTCPTANVGMSGCVKEDIVFTDKLIDMSVDYYDEDENLIDIAGGGTPSDAERIVLSVTLGTVAYGSEVRESASISMKKLN